MAANITKRDNMFPLRQEQDPTYEEVQSKIKLESDQASRSIHIYRKFSGAEYMLASQGVPST